MASLNRCPIAALTLSISVRPYSPPFRAITVNRKVAKLLNVGSDVCAR